MVQKTVAALREAKLFATFKNLNFYDLFRLYCRVRKSVLPGFYFFLSYLQAG